MSMVIRLWDTLFSDPDRFNFLKYVCVAMVVNIREDLLEGDFAACLSQIQRSADYITDIRKLLNKANLLCHKYGCEDDQMTYKNVLGLHL
jgi:hypothetical protein